ncbi:MAG TPA: rod shape-determining protein MreD [Terriglobales bacterium]|nr:rod shape-determining protein MreD [Terriglobales bacterium]
MRTAVVQTMRADESVYRFNGLITVGVPLLAIFIRAFLPIRFHFVSWFELPLLVTIYFALARRSQVAGLMTGAIIGLAQDSMTTLPIGISGIANTIVGYGASSLSVKIDTDNPGSRALITFGFYLLYQFVYMTVARAMLQIDIDWEWRSLLLKSAANAIVAVILFAFLDHFRQKV